jgi:hypothetical protein
VKYLLAIAMLTGCASFDAPPAPQIKRQGVVIQVSEGSLPDGVQGTAAYYDTLNICQIVLRKYPRCLLHEVRHCIEGAWHDDRPNTEDC